jgi:alpha-tubulin suppressor-like RCC1 family protein
LNEIINIPLHNPGAAAPEAESMDLSLRCRRSRKLMVFSGYPLGEKDMRSILCGLLILSFSVYADPFGGLYRAYAGPDITTAPNVTVTLAGFLYDNTYDEPATQTQWTWVSGPAGIQFSNPAQLRTDVSFPVVGTYVLKLSASNGVSSSNANCTVTVVANVGNLGVYAWGNGTGGQLGDATFVSKSVPTIVPGTADISQMSAGYDRATGAKADGSAWSWGAGAFLNKTPYDFVRNAPGPMLNTTNVRTIHSGGLLNIAVRNDGSYDYFDSPNTLGQRGGQITVSPGIVIASAGSRYGLLLCVDGTVMSFGENDNGVVGHGTLNSYVSRDFIPSLNSIVAISAGASHALALKSDGTVYAWGLNSSGQLGIGTLTSSSVPILIPELSGVIAVAAGRSHSVALKSDGTVWTWGQNAFGELGDGGVVGWRPTPAIVGALPSISKISAGGHTLATESDGSIWSWGLNNHGQLGDGTKVNRATPVRVPGIEGSGDLGGLRFQPRFGKAGVTATAQRCTRRH